MNNYYVYSSNSQIILNGELIYFSQQPIVMTDTIKNNIIFNNEYNEERYRQVVSICDNL